MPCLSCSSISFHTEMFFCVAILILYGKELTDSEFFFSFLGFLRLTLTSCSEKIKHGYSLLLSDFDLKPEDIERLKSADVLTQLIEEVRSSHPLVWD